MRHANGSDDLSVLAETKVDAHDADLFFCHVLVKNTHFHAIMSSIKGTCVMSTSNDGSRISLTCTRTDFDASGNADVSGNVDVSGNIASTQIIPQSIAECAFAPGPNTGQVMMTCNHVAAWTDPSGSVLDVPDVSGELLSFGNLTYTTYMAQTNNEYSYL